MYRWGERNLAEPLSLPQQYQSCIIKPGQDELFKENGEISQSAPLDIYVPNPYQRGHHFSANL